MTAISVIIATCNGGAWIGRAVDSVLTQDYPTDAIEIIIVEKAGKELVGYPRHIGLYRGDVRYELYREFFLLTSAVIMRAFLARNPDLAHKWPHDVRIRLRDYRLSFANRLLSDRRIGEGLLQWCRGFLEFPHLRSLKPVAGALLRGLRNAVST